MTEQQREFWISLSDQYCLDSIYTTKPPEHTTPYDPDSLEDDREVIHVIEAGPVLEKIARLEAALEKCLDEIKTEHAKAIAMTNHIFEKGNVNWGHTFVKWDIMNEGLIAMDKIKSILEG